METKLIKFDGVLRKHNLTKRQVYHILEKIKKYHTEDHWFRNELNEFGERELWIYMEGAEWIQKVYLNYSISYLTAEINFTLEQIERLESEFNYHKEPTKLPDMDVKMLASFFSADTSTIHRVIKKYLAPKHPEYLRRKRPMIVYGAGVRWLLENVFREKYLLELLSYKRQLQNRKREIML